MSGLILLHNPRYSKSRVVLELLGTCGLQPQMVRYLETPSNAAELKAILAKLGIPAHQLLRTGEDKHKAFGLDEPGLGEEIITEAMTKHSKLIEHPVLAAGDKAVVSQPPERVLEILA